MKNNYNCNVRICLHKNKKKNLIIRINLDILHQIQPLASLVIFSENMSKSKLS